MFGSGGYVLPASCAVFNNTDYPSPHFCCKPLWHVFLLVRATFTRGFSFASDQKRMDQSCVSTNLIWVLLGQLEWASGCAPFFFLYTNESVILNWTLSVCFPPQRRGKKGEHIVFERSEFGDFLGRTIFSVRCISWAMLGAPSRDLPEAVRIPGVSTDSGNLCSELPAMAGR